MYLAEEVAFNSGHYLDRPRLELIRDLVERGGHGDILCDDLAPGDGLDAGTPEATEPSDVMTNMPTFAVLSRCVPPQNSLE